MVFVYSIGLNTDSSAGMQFLGVFIKLHASTDVNIGKCIIRERECVVRILKIVTIIFGVFLSIMLVVGSLSYSGVRKNRPTEEGLAMVRMEFVADALKAYYSNYHLFPEHLQELMDAGYLKKYSQIKLSKDSLDEIDYKIDKNIVVLKNNRYKLRKEIVFNPSH